MKGRAHTGRQDVRQAFLTGSQRQISELRSALAAEGLRPVSGEPLGTHDVWSRRLKQSIAESDVVIALLDPPKNAPQTFYELGLAEGMGKPILLVVSPQTSLPVDITGHLVVRPGNNLIGAVLFAVGQWMASGQWPSPTAGPRGAEDHPVGPSVDRLLSRLDQLETSGASHEFEQLVMEALASSAEAVVEPSAAHRHADLGVWSDALASSVGNPLLVEVKPRLLSPPDIDRIVDQLCGYLNESTARTALLVYAGTPPEAVVERLKTLPPSVLAISLRRLLEELRALSLSTVVGRLRDLQSVPAP